MKKYVSSGSSTIFPLLVEICQRGRYSMMIQELYSKDENLSWTEFSLQEELIKRVNSQMENLFNTHEKLDENSVILGRNIRLIKGIGERDDGKYNVNTVYFDIADIDKIQEYLKLCNLDDKWDITVETFKQPFNSKLVLHRK